MDRARLPAIYKIKICTFVITENPKLETENYSLITSSRAGRARHSCQRRPPAARFSSFPKT
jgi:hypothetical protein